VDGGTHLTGLRSAVTRAINDCAPRQGWLKDNDPSFSGDDTREGLTAIVSVRLSEPQFESQTKVKLMNAEVRSQVESVVTEGLAAFLEGSPAQARSIVQKCLTSSRARAAARHARELVIHKSVLESLSLPGKLADCSERNPARAELFIVEGDSAGGSAKQGRDRNFQAVLPLRGKIINTERTRLDRVLDNKEIQAIISALGCGIGDQFDLDGLRYGYVIILADADVDGAHIATLLLTFFFRYMPDLIDKGHLFIAQPPLYRIEHRRHVTYAYTEAEKDALLGTLGDEAHAIQRYKGLGEMNPEQLWETTMDPQRRLLLQISIDNAAEADRTFDMLMGPSVPPRRRFIQTHARQVRNLDI
jgi:DNA gyrase subunit B